MDIESSAVIPDWMVEEVAEALTSGDPIARAIREMEKRRETETEAGGPVYRWPYT